MCFVVFAAYPCDSTATTYAHMAIPKPASSFKTKCKVQYWDRTKRGEETSVSESAPFGGAVVGFEAVPLTILSVHMYVLIFLHLLRLGLVTSDFERSCAPVGGLCRRKSTIMWVL